MKKLTESQVAQVKRLEQKGDDAIEKETFDSCLSAIDFYLGAKEKLFELANDDKASNAKPYPTFNSDVVSYKAWYMELGSKLDKANALLASPKTART